MWYRLAEKAMSLCRGKPKTLYKFRSWSHSDPEIQANHRTILFNKTLWIPAASELNDPLDCRIPFRYDRMKRDDLIERMVRLYVDHSPKPRPVQEIRQDAEKRIEALGIYDPARKAQALDKLSRVEQANYGVLSFSSRRDSHLLWAHYANSYSGICVGLSYGRFTQVIRKHFYDTKVPSIERWIKYTKRFPAITPSNDDDLDFDLSVIRNTTKLDVWKYESEYRYVFGGLVNKPFGFRPECVSEVILGPEMSTNDRTEVSQLVRKDFPGAQLLQARRKPLDFELQFRPIG